MGSARHAGPEAGSQARVALVTGARTGVGLELTRRLLSQGWDVATLTRAPLPLAPAFADAIEAGRLRPYIADLADYGSLRHAVSAIRERETAIAVLFNNAGVNPETFETSPQAREMCFEVNTVVPYILSRELLSLLSASGNGLIVNVSSNAVRMAKTFDPAKLGTGEAFKKLFGAYANSKLALSLWTQAVAAEFAADGVSILSADPGPTKSPLTAGPGMPWALKIIAKVLFKPPGVAAAKLLDLVESGDRFATGSYVEKGKVIDLPRKNDAATVLGLVERIHRDEYPAR